MKGCFPQVITEAMRLTLTPDNVGQLLMIKLNPAPDSGNRARASAKYNIEILLPWLAGAFATGVTLIDGRGYALAWTFAKLGDWMVKGLAGDGFAVAIEIKGAQTLPARWTVERINSSLSKVQAMGANEMQAEAAAKVASVSKWASGARKTAVIDAAARMVEAADLLLLVQGWQGGGSVMVVTDRPDTGAAVDPLTGIYWGALPTGQTVQWIAVHLLQGVSVQIDLEGLDGGVGTLGDPAFSLFDVVGLDLNNGADDYDGTMDARLYFVPDYSGLHFVSVYAASGTGGTYRLTVAEGVGPAM